MTAKRHVDPIRPFVLDNFSNKVWGDGEEVDFISETFGRGNGGDVGVDEDRGDTSLPEGLEGLGACVVE